MVSLGMCSEEVLVECFSLWLFMGAKARAKVGVMSLPFRSIARMRSSVMERAPASEPIQVTVPFSVRSAVA